MDEQRDADESQVDRDLEIIVPYMNGSLEPQARAEVGHRLEHDPEFYDLVSPLIFASWVGDKRDFAPGDGAERKEIWAEFERFVISKHKVRKRRRRLYACVLLGLLALLATVLVV